MSGIINALHELRADLQRREVDPNGRDPHEPGAKLDVGKVRAGLLVADFPGIRSNAPDWRPIETHPGDEERLSPMPVVGNE